MRWLHFILIQCLLVLIVGGVFYIHSEQVAAIKKPPTSLAQWYKPQNKRQVWLHNMFKLRREMQAVRFYADNKDGKNLEKWLKRLEEHYLKIGEMVPKWKSKLNRQVMTDLVGSAKAGRYQDVPAALDKLNENCKSCHTEYRVITATLYRSPDFSSLEIGSSESLKSHMKKLTRHVNQIKIASEDGMRTLALSSLSFLRKDMLALGETCVNCHEKSTAVYSATYPNEVINTSLNSLEKSLATGSLKEQGRNLGTLAVLACARCHGTHRFSSDARKLLMENPDWSELIKH